MALRMQKLADFPLRVHGKVKARQLFDWIVEQAWSNGEPGNALLELASPTTMAPALALRKHESVRRAVPDAV